MSDTFADWNSDTIRHLLRTDPRGWRASAPWPIVELAQRFAAGDLLTKAEAMRHALDHADLELLRFKLESQLGHPVPLNIVHHDLAAALGITHDECELCRLPVSHPDALHTHDEEDHR